MRNHEADGQETSNFKTISISVGIRSNYNGKGSEKLSCNMVSSGPGLVGRSSFAEAKMRLQKLERDYQHTCEKYTELRSENVVEQLQMVLDKLNTEEAPKRGRDTPSNSKQFFLMHGCKSLAQEKMKLQLKSDNKEEYNDDMSQETIDVQKINEKLNYIQRTVPKISSKKPLHDLVRRVKEIKKLMEKAISNGALVGNHTSQDNMKNSTRTEIKLLTKLIRDLVKEKEKRETGEILQDERKIGKRYKEKMRHLQEKIQCIGEKRDAEKKYILDLEKFFNSRHKTVSQRKGCPKG